VFWIGEIRPGTQQLLELLQFSVDTSSPTNRLTDDGFLGGLAAVVFAQDVKKPMSIVDDLASFVTRLLDFECLVFALASNAGLQSVVNVLTAARVPSIWPTGGPEQFVRFDGQGVRNLTVDGEPPFPHVRVYRASAPSEEQIAKLAHLYGPRFSPAPDDPKEFEVVLSDSTTIDAEDRLMLRRSFHDCARVDLTRMSGRSGARVFMAHALVRDPPLGRRPLPFFVKVGKRRKIITEWANYKRNVEQYIPFHLAPRVVEDRCGLGGHRGIIVGDFIEESESLRQCALSGRAVAPLGGLFERTLRGWHLQAVNRRESFYFAMKGLITGNLSASRHSAAKVMGARRTLEELREDLKKKGKEMATWGPTHGDLHADNVRVRGSEAILIDFYCTRPGPLLSDPAALEISLAIGVPLAKDFDRVAWTEMMRELYSQPALRAPPAASLPTHPFAWLAKCVRQIRLHALPVQQEDGQYARVLAYRLLQAAIKDHGARPAEDFRRTSAFCFAEELLGMKWLP
jgi:Ternary complex associated domain 9